MEHLIDETFERRRSRRRRVDTPVRLLPDDHAIPIEGSVTNLGPTGMFVATEEVALRVNAEVTCNLSHPERREFLPVRGRVIWVQDQPAGVGIEFVDLEEPHRSWLQEVVEQREPGEEVKVWLETLAHPIRATVVHTKEGLHLRAPLPFLRLLSSVIVYPVESPEQGFSGTLDAVTLTQGEGTTPELRLHLSFEEPEIEEASEVEEPELEVEEPELEELAITLPRQEAVGEFEVRSQPVLEIEAEPPVAVEPCEDLLQEYSIAPDAPPTDPNWSVCLGDMDLGASEQSQWSLTSHEVESAVETEKNSKKRSSRRHVWLWLAASVLVAFTVASMVHTKAWSRAWRWTKSRLDDAPPVTAADEPSIAALPEAIKPIIVPAEAPAPAIPAAKKRLEKRATKERSTQTPRRPLMVSTQPDVVKGPHVITAGPGRTLVVPVSGSMKDAVHYRLAEPDGLVVNLPNARPRVSFGDYPLSDRPFRLIWLRRREGGMHLRVLFQGKLPQYRLRLRGGAVRVVLEPPSD